MSELPKHLTLFQKSKAPVSWQPFWACFYHGRKVQMLLQFPWLSLYTCTKGYFFLHLPCRSSQETAEILTTTDSASCSPEKLKPCEWAGQANVMQLQHPSIWQNRWHWGKGEAVRSAGTWKIMNAPNLLSITGSYFDWTSQAENWGLFITQPSANCVTLTTVTHTALDVSHLQPGSLGRLQNSLTFAPILGAISALNMQKPQRCFSLNLELCPWNADFFKSDHQFLSLSSWEITGIRLLSNWLSFLALKN